MGNIIEAKDPRGIKISCSRSQWENHIAADTGHPVMAVGNNIKAIIETIEAPDYVYESHDSAPSLDYREVFSKI